MKRIFFSAFLLVSVAQAQTLAPPPQKSVPSITVDELSYHVRWLSSDELEGRRTGTKANDVAAEYIAREFKRYGLKPAGEDGYFQSFSVVTGVELGKNNRFAVNDEAKTLGKDFTPFSFSSNGTASGEVIFVGYGISAPQKQHDDYSGIKLDGRIALAVSGHPGSDDPHSEFTSMASIRSKALFAREAGARALLVVNPEMKELYELRYDGSPSNAGIIVLSISKAVADDIVRERDYTIDSLVSGMKSKEYITFTTGVNVDVDASVELVRKNTRNVIGKLEGSDAAARERFIVVGAHFDHLGWGESGSLYKGETPMIHNGADDNASGTAGMLELAQHFAAKPPKHSMVFMGFSGEEMGLLGSAHWVNKPTVPLSNITAMINLDMIGRLPDSTRKLHVQGIGTSPLWKALVEKLNEPYKFQLALIDDGQGSSDHSSFYMKDIPVLFFFTGLHSDYHRPSDDFETLNLRGQHDVTRYVAEILGRVDGESEKIAFTKVQKKEQQVRGFNVYVGTIPDYGWQEEGFRISGTSPGGPAEKAGLKEGDVIIKFGSTTIKNIYDYMNALSQHKPEEDVPVVVKRGSETVTLTVHLVKK